VRAETEEQSGFPAVSDFWMDPKSTYDLLQNGMLKRIFTARSVMDSMYRLSVMLIIIELIEE
jgi:hypothetical protein